MHQPIALRSSARRVRRLLTALALLLTLNAALARILSPGGRLILRYRGPRDGVEREANGRLFSPIAPDRLGRLLQDTGLVVLHTGPTPEQARPDITWHGVVAERPR